ncbi:MAG: PHP domain-containing protein [Christensenellales bacterium]
MPLQYDFHIHSCLSPCADDDMTPGNICMMARLNGLQAIAVTDHQSAGNLRALAGCAGREGLLLLPGLEICTREELHLLAYFEGLAQAEAMGAWCRERLPARANRPDYFGHQWLMDEDDRVRSEEPLMLILALTAGLGEVCRQIRLLGGVPVPAHINRGSSGILSSLGFLPPEEDFRAVEVAPDLPAGTDLSGLRVLRGSDAHRLADLAGPGATLPLPAEPGALITWLKGG